MFIAVVDAILKVQVPGVNRDPCTVEAHEDNMQALLDFLAEVIGTDLSHINHQNICHGKAADICNMLEIVMRLADIMQGTTDDDDCESGGTDRDGMERTRFESVDVMEDSEGDIDSSDGVLKEQGPGRHLAQRARQRLAAPRGGDMTVDGFIGQQVREMMARLEQRERVLAAAVGSSGSAAEHKVVFKPRVAQDAEYRKAGAVGVTVKSKARLTAGLGMPGYLRPTQSALAAARKVDNLTCWGTGWPPSPRLARPRPDTGPPMPNPWRPLPLARHQEKSPDQTGMEAEDDGWVLVEGRQVREAARGAGGAGGWCEHLTAAAEAKQQRAALRSAAHRTRREKHQRRQLEQELRRMHESAWLAASHEITRAVGQRVACAKRLQRQAGVLEQARSKAQHRRRAAQILAQKAALEQVAADQVEMAQAAIRAHGYQVKLSQKAAAEACLKLERDARVLQEQWMREAMEDMQCAFRHQTLLASSALVS